MKAGSKKTGAKVDRCESRGMLEKAAYGCEGETQRKFVVLSEI